MTGIVSKVYSIVTASAPSSVLADFLSTSKTKYLNEVQTTTDKADDWTVVMGNEAGDLDSIASSIAYAYFQSKIHKKPTIPLIQIGRDDLGLRGENIYALELAGIAKPEEQLLLSSDFTSVDPFPSHRFALVDHNRLGPAYVSENAQVDGIIDHHADEGLYTDTTITNPRIITPAGSCTSLIAASLFLPVDTENATSEVDPLPKELAILLLSALLIDTDGLKPSGKAIDVDRQAALFLASKAEFLPNSSFSSSSLHESDIIQTLADNLMERKFDLSHLSPNDHLRRDYKEYTYSVPWASSNVSEPIQLKAGLSTVPAALSSWAAGGVLEREGEKWMKERSLSILGVLTSYRRAPKHEGGKGKHEREMAWIIRTDSLQAMDWDLLEERLWSGLKASAELEVKKHKDFVIDDNGESNLRIKVFTQNPKATRKVSAPVLKGIMEGEAHDKL
ncbi:DHH phosphoesterase [Dendrothele bispora CBS 962.96]|uniref:DHH phosphoesterase n=1 Tax=Dendrothele bispora (strain CBS 962.96) TaxID=1314807 RepID=A0A4S8MRV3_DENBC|nr:DHH phosphoesterase [Dendrothele bispora CBS 962.96]